MNPWEDRPYQQKAHDAVCDQFDQGVPSTLLVMPTGTGKTRVAALMAQTAKERGLKTLFLVHREILLRQAQETLEASGMSVAIEMAGENAQLAGCLFGSPDVVCGTVQTLQGDRLARWDPNEFGLVITDECHRAADPSHQAVYRHFGSALHLGITATPDGCQSCQLGRVYQTLAYQYGLKEAVLDGYLVRPRHERCELKIDLKGLRQNGGDFNAGDLGERIGPHLELLADAIKQRIGSRLTVVFLPSVPCALSLAAILRSNSPSGPGLPAEYVAGRGGSLGVSPGTRSERLACLDRGDIQVICCCDLLFEGWDCRPCSCCVIARPTRLRYRYAQMVGRILRLYEGKEDGLIVDFDWQCDDSARDLVGPEDLFLAEDPDYQELTPDSRRQLRETARKLLEKGVKDPLKAVEEAKEYQKRAETIPLFLRGFKAEFAVEELDPLGVAHLLGAKLKKRYDFQGTGYREAEPWQFESLKNLGVHHPERLSFFGAQKLLREAKRRAKEGLATLGQLQRLTALGVSETLARAMTKAQAHHFLTENHQ